jgi:hypothetical protein
MVGLLGILYINDCPLSVPSPVVLERSNGMNNCLFIVSSYYF